MRLEILTKNTGWYGSHSGYYERLPEHLALIHARTRITKPIDHALRRAMGKLISVVRRPPARNQSITFAEELFRLRFRGRDCVGHILGIEDNHLVLKRWDKAPRNLLGTIHYPPDLLNSDLIDSLGRLASAIVLYRRDLEFFEKLVGKGRVVWVRHGVDVSYFKPSPSAPHNEAKRLAYVGQFGRDTAMFARIVPMLLQRYSNLEVDVVVAREAFVDQNLLSLKGMNRVHFHSGVSDDELLRIYQGALALLLPMKASGANNAIVEALACGLPVLTTNIGGIHDYGGDTLFPVVSPGDDDGLIDLTVEHLGDPEKFTVMRRQLREFAEVHLSWPAVAAAHFAAYRQLSESA